MKPLQPGENSPTEEFDSNAPLFCVEMMWGQQPVRLTAYRCFTLPEDAPVTSVHIVAFCGERVLVVRDRKGAFGFPGGRLEEGETREEAMVREVYEEACAHLEPGYTLFGVLKIECTTQLPGRAYHYPFSYMAMYAGMVKGMEPVRRDPAGIITGRDLFSAEECARRLDSHDRILLREAANILKKQPAALRRIRTFLDK